MFDKKTLHDYDIADKKVLLRADYNVPLTSDGKIQSSYRITQSAPTIQALIDKGCRIVICSHLGRPKGEPNEKLSLRPVAKELSKLLDRDVKFVSEAVGDKVVKATESMEPGSVVLLENLRFYPGEKENSEDFARQIVESTGAEVFVQDGFGVVHRKDASTDAVARQLPALAGLLLEKEISIISHAINNPDHPLMAIIGGSKIKDKIDIIYKFIDIADIVVIGGAMANTFLKAEGVEVGDSLVDNDELDTARDVIEKVREVSRARKFVFYLPQDGVVAKTVDSKARTRVVDWDHFAAASIEAYPKKPSINTHRVGKDEKILDVGPISSSFISGAIQLCRTVIWNGTMGVAEVSPLHGTVGPYAHGTEAVIDGLVGRYGNKPFSILGGGDTSGYIDKRGLNDMFSHVSTGGGASLDLMAGKELPGIAVLWGK